MLPSALPSSLLSPTPSITPTQFTRAAVNDKVAATTTAWTTFERIDFSLVARGRRAVLVDRSSGEPYMSLAQPNSVLGRPPPTRPAAFGGNGEEQREGQVCEVLAKLEHAAVLIEIGPGSVEEIFGSSRLRDDVRNVFPRPVVLELTVEPLSLSR
jgi:hypothetical protein